MENKAGMIVAAAVICGSGVGLGAFGAHGLRETLEATGRVSAWEKAVLYQLIHGLALFALAVWQHRDPVLARAMTARAAGWLWIAGVVLFSGSLYALSLGAPRGVGPVTPLGGLAFLLGWLALGWCGWRAAGVRAPKS